MMVFHKIHLICQKWLLCDMFALGKMGQCQVCTFRKVVCFILLFDMFSFFGEPIDYCTAERKFRLNAERHA